MILITNGKIFDGSQEPSFVGSVLIDGDKVKKIFKEGDKLPDLNGEDRIIDATDCWITPGFIDSHTHYDFELLVNPILGESVRHGITTVFAGSCSITPIVANAEDCSDIFTRVEGVPREHVLPVLEGKKTWSSPREYKKHLQSLPLGANVCQYLGHSDIRMAAMGIEKATQEDSVPTADEQKQMTDLLQEALDEGFIGMSSMQTFLDKLDGDRVRSRGLPCVYANFDEYAFLNKVLRDNDRVLQTSPDINDPNGSTGFLMRESTGFFRTPLRMSILALIDTKATRGSPFVRLQTFMVWFMRKLFKSNFRWQMLPCEFSVQVRGMDFVIFEEVPSGEAYLHLSEKADREKLVRDPEFRAQFKKDIKASFQVGTWNRDIGDGLVVECADQNIVGKTFEQIAKEQDKHVADTFIDLLIEHGENFVWKLVLGNELDKGMAGMYSDKLNATQVSFSDAGAHIQNMSFYNFPLQMLARLQNMRKNGLSKMSDEKCIHRLTGEIADWFRIDAGYIKAGKRADINILDPRQLPKALDSVVEENFPGVEGLTRFVNRNDGILKKVIINGEIAASDDEFSQDFGQNQNYGQFLEAL